MNIRQLYGWEMENKFQNQYWKLFLKYEILTVQYRALQCLSASNLHILFKCFWQLLSVMPIHSKSLIVPPSLYFSLQWSYSGISEGKQMASLHREQLNSELDIVYCLH